jgi:hypothetical protein
MGWSRRNGCSISRVLVRARPLRNRWFRRYRALPGKSGWARWADGPDGFDWQELVMKSINLKGEFLPKGVAGLERWVVEEVEGSGAAGHCQERVAGRAGRAVLMGLTGRS